MKFFSTSSISSYLSTRKISRLVLGAQAVETTRPTFSRPETAGIRGLLLETCFQYTITGYLARDLLFCLSFLQSRRQLFTIKFPVHLFYLRCVRVPSRVFLKMASIRKQGVIGTAHFPSPILMPLPKICLECPVQLQGSG